MGTAEEVKCMYCAEEQRVLSFHDLKRGDHICLAGGKRFNVFQRQYAMYKHHALIKAIIQIDTNGFSAMVTMIHFIWTPFSKSIEIRETTDVKNLYNDEIYKYKYCTGIQSPDKIVHAAENMLKQRKSYGFLTNNCEHLVRQCLVGESKSLQVDYFARNIIQWGIQAVGFIGIFLQNTDNTVQAAVILLVIMTLLSLSYCSYRTYRFLKKNQNKHICEQCYSKKKRDIWLPFAAYAISNLVGCQFLLLANTHLLADVFFFGSVIMSAFSMYLTKTVFVGLKKPVSRYTDNKTPDKKIQNMQNKLDQPKYDRTFSGILDEENEDLPQVYIDHRRGKVISTKRYEKRVVRLHTDIKEGDLIEFELIKVVCTNVSECPNSDTRFNMSFVPYGSSYQGKENNKTFDLESDRLFKYWCHPVHRYTKDDIIRWKEENVKGQIYRRPGENAVIISVNDVREGDAITYMYYGLWHEAVVIGKQKNNDKEDELEIIHYGLDPSTFTMEVRKDSLKIFDKTRIERKEFNGYYTYPNKITVERAISRIDERRFTVFRNTSSDFVHWCKVVQVPSVFSIQSVASNEHTQVVVIPHIGTVDEESFHKNWIKTEEELVIGSIIQIKGDIGILTSFQRNEIKLLCFDAIQQKVVSIQYPFDLKKTKQCIWIYWCNPYNCNRQHIVLNKSFECLGKKNKIPAVISAWEFCKWCVLRKYTESFYKKEIMDFKGITKGSILKVQGHYGLFCENKLWCYNRGRKVVIQKMELDSLKQTKDRWIYWSNSKSYYTGDEIMQRATSIGDDECPAVLTEWEFCKRCVLVEWEESFYKKRKRDEEKLTEGSIINIKGNFGIVKYSTDDETQLALYNTASKTVKIENISSDKNIWIYRCNLDKRYTIDDIIERVSDREKYKLPDFQTQWEFCKWCVLIEYTDSFYKKLIKPGEELIPGSIIRVGSQSGILKSTKGNKFELMYYNESKKDVKIEQFDLPTDNENYWIYWFNSSTCFTGEDIIERAVDRPVYEIISAWEFCKWCVLIGYAELFYKKLTKTSDELTKGSILKVQGHLGILISIEDNKINLMCYNRLQKAVTKKTICLINDNQVLIWVYWCSSSRCHLLDDIIKRASDSDKYETPAFKSDWEFCVWCVLIGNAESFTKKRLKQEQDVKIGMILKVKSRFGIVTSLTHDNIELQCYNQSQKAIISKSLDFKNDNEDIWIYPCNEITCHTSSDIIERATKLANHTSQAFKSEWEFCKWCVLLGYAESFYEMSIQPSKGSILEVGDQLGILTSLTNKTISLLCYDKTVREFNLQKLFENCSWIYQCNPITCHSTDDIFKISKDWKNDKIQVFKSEWEFYHWCVLIGYRESFQKRLMTEITELTIGSILKVNGRFGILKSITNNSIVLSCYNQNQKGAVDNRLTLDVDKNEPIWIYGCNARNCHTPDVIIERTSNSQKSFKSEWEFFEWCVLLGYTDVFDKKSISVKPNKEFLGSVLEVEGKLGILTSITINTIKLLCYDKTEQNFDLQTFSENGSWIYLCNENTCHFSDDIIKRANDWKKDKFQAFKSEWEFFKWCVLIGYPEPFQKKLMKKITELTIGSILKVRGQFGILQSVTNSSIVLACYNQNLKKVTQNGFCFDMYENKIEDIWIYWCNSRKCHTSTDIIERTYNSKMHKLQAFKSDWEFCEWCVLFGYTELFYKRSIYMPSKGSVLEVDGQMGILKSIIDNKIELIYYDRTETKFDIQSLNQDSRIYMCNPITCHSSEDIIKRANNWEKDKFQAFKSEWYFYKWCVLKEYPELFQKRSMKGTEELTIGCILKVSGLFGIVVKFTECTIGLAWYNQTLNKVVDRDIVLKKQANKKEDIWIYWCDSWKCHTSNDIIERSSYIRSHPLQTFKSDWEFCEWCVLFGYTELLFKKMIYMPSKGSVLEVDGQMGILKSIVDNKIELIYYDKTEKKFDLQSLNQVSSIYLCNPNICHSSDDIIKRANDWKKDKFQAFKSEWEFYKWCVLIGYPESFEKELTTETTVLTVGSILKVRGQFGILQSITNSSIVLACYNQNKKVIVYNGFNLYEDKKEEIWIYWCNSRKCHTPDDIIKRTSNRRIHKLQAFKSDWEFCEWCVLQKYTESIYKKSIQPSKGSIIRVEGLFGIVTSIKDNKIKLLCYDKGEKEFDLHKIFNKNSRIYQCNQNTCHSDDDIIKRANDWKKDTSQAFKSEWEFYKWCVLIGYPGSFHKRLMSDIAELTKGSILKIRDQFGIVKSVKNWSMKLAYRKTNKEDDGLHTIKLDKDNKELIWIYSCNSSKCHTPDDIIERTSNSQTNFISEWDFCEWCVLLGYTESFDKRLVIERDELTIGSILKVKGQFGILKSITENKIELVCYNQSQNDVTEFDSCEEINKGIWIYWCNSSRCHTLNHIVERAFHGNKNTIPDFSSAWEFCEWCVLK